MILMCNNWKFINTSGVMIDGTKPLLEPMLAIIGPNVNQYLKHLMV